MAQFAIDGPAGKEKKTDGESAALASIYAIYATARDDDVDDEDDDDENDDDDDEDYGIGSCRRTRRHPHSYVRSPARLRAYSQHVRATAHGGRAYSRGYAAGRVAPREPVVLSSLTQGRLAIPARSASRITRTLTLVRVVIVRVVEKFLFSVPLIVQNL